MPSAHVPRRPAPGRRCRDQQPPPLPQPARDPALPLAEQRLGLRAAAPVAPITPLHTRPPAYFARPPPPAAGLRPRRSPQGQGSLSSSSAFERAPLTMIHLNRLR